MKTLIFDLALQLRGISNVEDTDGALEELNRAEALSGNKADPNDWNVMQVSDEVATEMIEWQSFGSPLSVSPLKDLADWRRWKTERM